MVTTLAIFCVAVVAVSLIGGLLPLATVLSHTRLQVYLSFSAGAMLGAAFFHMMPEAVRMSGSPEALKWTAGGLLMLFLVERFFAYHHHEPPGVPADSHAHVADEEHAHSPAPGRPAASGRSLHWGAAVCGLMVHSVAGGVALASAAAANAEVRNGLGATAWGVFLATILHKPADALTIVSLMLRAGAPRALAHVVNLAFALMIPLGVVVFNTGIGTLGHQAANELTAAALAFSAGTFLCIALSDLLPELQFHSHDRWKLSLALVAGLGLMAAASAWEGPEVPLPHGPAVEKPAPADRS
jgi:zinc and cadmium transporter